MAAAVEAGLPRTGGTDSKLYGLTILDASNPRDNASILPRK